ncbi:hypothetical protein Bpfe_016301 [Biomphalaria pfeifferi]|uniref:Uncharacterized protein n=1 Tax=Biomphalaria pfeifferi TaxID=112525 RepID=A0AAD8BGK2_BIOPF|nr:hypothetical protein Bpfe_016301 [Biomphalaria pfeifferi]
MSTDGPRDLINCIDRRASLYQCNCRLMPGSGQAWTGVVGTDRNSSTAGRLAGLVFYESNGSKVIMVLSSSEVTTGVPHSR